MKGMKMSRGCRQIALLGEQQNMINSHIFGSF